MIFAFVNRGVGTYGLNATPVAVSDLLTFNSNTSSGNASNETDPTVPSHVKNITETNINNWNSAFGWGNHAGLYRPNNWVPSWAEVTGKPNFNRTTPGLVPNPGGTGITRYLREDGQWIEPPASSSGGGGTETDPTVPTHVKEITASQIFNWNTAHGWGNHAGRYTDRALWSGAGSHTNTHADTRGVNESPNSFNGRGTSWDFKQRITVGLPGSNNFATVMTVSQWLDFTGGGNHQIAFNDNEGLFYRYSVKTELSWGNWFRLWHSGNLRSNSENDNRYIQGVANPGTTALRNAWVGTQQQYNALSNPNPNTIYFIL